MIFSVPGELLPAEIRSFGTAFIFFLYNGVLFLQIKTLPLQISTIGISATFVVLSMSMATCLLIVYLFMPETHGLTLEEIEAKIVDDKKQNKILKSLEQ